MSAVEDGRTGPVEDAGTSTAEDAPTGQLVAGAVGDRCAACGAPLASDQRYCVQCGERRGKARFTPASMAGPTDDTPAQAQGAARERERRRPSSGAALVAGIATLLLAMGLGVEIGRLGTNNTTTQRASSPGVQVVTVGGGSGSSSGGSSGGASALGTTQPSNTPTTANTAAAQTNTNASNTKTNASFAPSAPIPKKVQAKAAGAASQVLGSTVTLAKPTVQPGQSCNNSQPGCQNGHFTGNFFSGG